MCIFLIVTFVYCGIVERKENSQTVKNLFKFLKTATKEQKNKKVCFPDNFFYFQIFETFGNLRTDAA